MIFYGKVTEQPNIFENAKMTITDVAEVLILKGYKT